MEGKLRKHYQLFSNLGGRVGALFESLRPLSMLSSEEPCGDGGLLPHREVSGSSPACLPRLWSRVSRDDLPSSVYPSCQGYSDSFCLPERVGRRSLSSCVSPHFSVEATSSRKASLITALPPYPAQHHEPCGSPLWYFTEISCLSLKLLSWPSLMHLCRTDTCIYYVFNKYTHRQIYQMLS